MAAKTIFVTVGTTSFDALIQSISNPPLLQALKEKGYSQLCLQIGKGQYEPPAGVIEGVTITVYRFKDSLAKDISNADLVISHAGAGSCLEVLDAGKPLIVVINEQLMDNHQAELAHALHSRGYAYACDVKNLPHTVEQMDPSTPLVPYPRSDNNCTFINFLDQVMGVNTSKS